MTEIDFAHLYAAHEARHGEVSDADLDRLVDGLDAHLNEVIDALPIVEEDGVFVLHVPDLDAIMRRFVAVRLGAVS